ncbi:MAG: SHOCT domain-containing protein [Verrucomicrobia bacterium]|nr:SHOCT domain-containing protein [Verrucomicrobiota bacterium]
MAHPILALFNLGGGEIILILALLLISALGPAAVVVIVLLAVRASQKQASPSVPPVRAPLPPLAPPQDLDQQLRTLAKLRDDGVITDEDFDTKKKALLGL